MKSDFSTGDGKIMVGLCIFMAVLTAGCLVPPAEPDVPPAEQDVYVVVGRVKCSPQEWTPVRSYLTIEYVVSEPTDWSTWGNCRLTGGEVLSLSPTEGMQLEEYDNVRGTATVRCVTTASVGFIIVGWVPEGMKG